MLDMRSKGFSDKLCYYENELGIPVAQMLVKYSGYLKEGLAKVDQRVSVRGWRLQMKHCCYLRSEFAGHAGMCTHGAMLPLAQCEILGQYAMPQQE